MRELFLTTLLLVGCGNGSVHSDAGAMKAYLGPEAYVDKATDTNDDRDLRSATTGRTPVDVTR
jgi:hypothetical protein